jgi:LuxR family transcriptional regulator (chaperone HchA-associated)
MTMSGSALERTTVTIAMIERSDDMATVCHAVRAFAHPLGYNRFVLYTAPPAGDEIVDEILWVEGDWFDNGVPVTPQTYIARCPVNRHVLETQRLFFWIKTGKGARESYRVVTHPVGLGTKGLQVPIFGHAGLVGAESFGGTSIDSSIEARLALSLIATAAFQAALRLTGFTALASVPQLSARELEVIRWIASGRRQVDVALPLGLLERTIENHLRRIRQRLAVSSTAQAVQVLVRSGAFAT